MKDFPQGQSASFQRGAKNCANGNQGGGLGGSLRIPKEKKKTTTGKGKMGTRGRRRTEGRGSTSWASGKGVGGKQSCGFGDQRSSTKNWGAKKGPLKEGRRE